MSEDINALIREHAPFVWRVLRHLGIPESQLDDASQEVFVVVFRKLHTFEGQSSLRTWLYAICRNVAHASRRRSGHGRELGMDDVPDEPMAPDQEGAVWARETADALGRVLATLAEDQRMVFVLFEIEELSMDEVSRALDAPLSTCYARLESARTKVAATMRRRELLAKARAGVAR